MGLDLEEGDIVKIREDLVSNKFYGGVYVVREMADFAGEHLEVIRVNEPEDGKDWVVLNERGHWRWTRQMFDLEVAAGEELQESEYALNMLL